MMQLCFNGGGVMYFPNKAEWTRPQAPVFSELPRYPTMLGQFIHTAGLFECAACL